MKRILAFEPDEELAAELKASFWRSGCVYEAVADAEEGIAKALAEAPDLILLTLELPKINGFSVCNKLKRNKTLQPIPLIILSSECTEETFDSHRQMKTRAEEYFTKPLDEEELLRKSRILLGLESAPEPEDELDDGETLAAPLTAISHSLDGAFDEIQDPVSGMEETLGPDSSESSGLVLVKPTPTPSPYSSRGQRVIVIWSPDPQARGQLFSFPEGIENPETGEPGALRVTVGRSGINNIVIADPAVAREHMSFEREGRDIYVRDLGSGNGTLVNDELCSHQKLRRGAVIRCGDTKFLYLGGLEPDAQFEAIVNELSVRDPSTRTYSRFALRDHLDIEIQTANQELTPLSLAAVSIDHIHKVAYRYGDLVAERVLDDTATLLRNRTPSGIIGRDIGAGFLVVMPGTSERSAGGLAEGWRFESGISEVVTERHTLMYTITCGVVQWRDGWTATDLLRRAYRLSYEGHKAGGNCVVVRGTGGKSSAPPNTKGEDAD